MNSSRFLKVLQAIGFLLILLLVIPSLGVAQTISFVEVSATVPIPNEDVSQAKEKALLEAKKLALQEVLSQLLPKEILANNHSLTRKSILSSPDRLIDSIRIIDETLTEDSEFRLAVEVRVFKPQFISILRGLGLPLLSDPLQEVSLLYPGDAAFWNTEEKRRVSLLKLNELLEPYKVKVKQLMMLSTEHQQVLQGQASIPENWLQHAQDNPFLYVDQSLGAIQLNQPASLNIEMRAYSNGGQFLEKASLKRHIQLPLTQEGIEESFQALSKKWWPVLKMLHSSSFMEKRVAIKIYGLPGPEQEVQFVSEVFRQNAFWEDVQLYILGKDHVVYQGLYRGKRKALLESLKKTRSERYHVSHVEWKDSQLLLHILWSEVPGVLASFRPPSDLASWVETYDDQPDPRKAPLPMTMVPTKKLKESYFLALNIPNYDYLQSRADNTSYFVYWPEVGGDARINWHRIGTSNLQPVMTIYNKDKLRVARFSLGNRSHKSIRYKLPEDESFFMIRISDNLGYAAQKASSYQFLHYTLEILPYSSK